MFRASLHHLPEQRSEARIGCAYLAQCTAWHCPGLCKAQHHTAVSASRHVLHGMRSGHLAKSRRAAGWLPQGCVSPSEGL